MTWRFVNSMTNLIGMGFTVPHGTVMSSYPIPPEGEWDLVVVWFHLPYYYYYRCSSSSKGWSVKVGQISIFILKLSQ